MILPLRLTPKGKWRRFALLGFAVLAIAGICGYSYVQHGFSVRMLYLVLIFLASFYYQHSGLKILGPINFLLLGPTGFVLWITFLLWDPSEHLPFGSDMEYPHLAGLGFGMVVGIMVVMTKAFDDDDGTLKGMIRDMRHYLVVLSGVAVAGYAMFLPYAYAMYQVFTEGNHIFALLAFFSIVALLAFAHTQVKARHVD